jgi:hypothetical protein
MDYVILRLAACIFEGIAGWWKNRKRVCAGCQKEFAWDAHPTSLVCLRCHYLAPKSH